MNPSIAAQGRKMLDMAENCRPCQWSVNQWDAGRLCSNLGSDGQKRSTAQRNQMTALSAYHSIKPTPAMSAPGWLKTWRK